MQPCRYRIAPGTDATVTKCGGAQLLALDRAAKPQNDPGSPNTCVEDASRLLRYLPSLGGTNF